jgi:protein-S-isoprenylcysteine O-methyltransferase Ste14
MALRNELEKSGFWLFRYRSFLPLAGLPVFAFCMLSYSYLGRSPEINEWWQVLCLLVSLVGLAVRIISVGHAPHRTSGRNTHEQVADSLSTTGMYSLVRHPLYLGNFLMFIGFVLFFHIWWLVLLASCIYALYYERIMLAEEEFLRKQFGDKFEAWAAATPAFIPRLRGWKSPALPFCWRTVLRREYSGLFLITTTFFILDAMASWSVARHIKPDWLWISIFAFGLMMYLALRTLKKHSRLLHVPGR